MPSDLAERLPKALIHHNVPGQPVHAFLQAFDVAWAGAAGFSTFGPRQRWTAAVESLAADGWPLIHVEGVTAADFEDIDYRDDRSAEDLAGWR